MDFNEYKNKILSEYKDFKKRYIDKDEIFKFEVANLITEARIYAGLTQKELAKKIKTRQPSIARIERGLSLPSLSFLKKIAKALDTYLIAPKFGFMEKSCTHRLDTRIDSKIDEIPSYFSCLLKTNSNTTETENIIKINN